MVVVVGAGYGLTRYRSVVKFRQATTVAYKGLLGMLPTFVAVFGLVGLFQVFVPPSLVERWLGREVAPSPCSSAPLSDRSLPDLQPAPSLSPDRLSRRGHGCQQSPLFIVSWVLVGVVSLPFEGRVFGWRYALTRNGTSFLLAMLIGLAIGWLV